MTMPQEGSCPGKPGEEALRVMKIANEVEVFKKPFRPSIKSGSKPKKVLDEDLYVHEMGKIIQRDFFPDLEKLKAQNEYLEAVEKNDVQKMRELYAKYSSGKRPPTERYASPANFETPQDLRGRAATPGGESDIGSELPDGDNMSVASDSYKPSLDEYLSTHTSEDNQSFQEIAAEAEVKHRHKFGWLYAEEDRCAADVENMLALPSIEQQANCTQRPLMVDTWGYKNKNYIMYVPDGVALTPTEEVEQAKRRKEIVHGNTRLATSPFDEAQSRREIQQLAHCQAVSAKDGRIGVDGLEMSAVQEPNVAGFSFVATPSPAPGVCESPLMTWGEIEGTPFRLDGGDTPLRPGNRGPSFRMAEPPKRETLALSLAEKAGERHRDRKKKAIIAARKQLASPSPRTGTMDRLSSMSPAARRLASSQLGGRLGSDRALQASYSPRVAPPPSPHTPAPSTSSARRNISTDNLLNLPRRSRAADFFDS